MRGLAALAAARRRDVAAVWQDLRHAARALRRRPGFTIVVGLTLALGVGANTAVFTVVNAVLLAPLPFADPVRLVTVTEVAPAMNTDLVSPITFADWQERNDVFVAMAAFRYWPNVTLEDETDAVAAEAILHITATPNLFAVLGINPLIGRPFADDGTPIGAAEAVISYDVWRRRFHGDPRVLGRTVRVHGTPLTIVGVMPPVRAGMLIGWGDLWSPLRRYDIRQQRATQYRSRYLSVVARLRPGVTLAQSRGRMTTLQHHLAQEATSVAQGFEARVDAIETTLVGGMRPVLFLVLVAAGLAYLAACANVGNLMFARAVGRERETAMRLALGASRGRVLTAALAEGAVLSLFGFALGLVVARVSLFAIVAANADIPRFDGTGVDGGLDGRVLAFAAISAVAAMLLASAAPLVGVRLRSLQLALREGGRAGASGARNRVRSAFVAAQIALACVLVIGAGLLTVSLARLMHIDPGFRARGAVIADFNNPRIWSSKDAERALATRDMLRHLSEQPGISAAGILLYFPYHPKLWQATAFAEGATPRPGEETAVYYNLFAGEYFRAMGIPLLAGRLPTESEMWEPSTRVAVVNAAFARTVFGSPSPIGKRFHPGQGAAPVTVIGVVGDVRQRRLDDPPRAEYYVPFSSMPMPFGTLVVRGTSRDGSAQADVATARRVAAAMRAVEPGLAAARVLPLESFVAASERDRRVAMVTLFMFAVTTALLAALGLYGVMSYAVVERRPEIGVRMALGATSARIVRQFVGHGLRSAAVGIASGVLLAVILSRMLASLLYGVDWLDAMVFVAAPLALTLLAIAVSTIPAARAARGNPTAALRG